MKTDAIRQAFLEYFKSKGHEIVPSDSLVPKDDPTLLFTGAGMNQFKEKFLGRNIIYKRAATCQKCLRTADLEKVGKTSGHHTFFEMLGNFSFGDYFKKEAIEWAWEFLTRNLRLKSQDLWASVYEDDDEAYDVWKDIIKLPKEKIVRLGEKENFWPSEAPTKGPNGPCGPCSEIFFDWGKNVGCGRLDCSPACDCGRFIEVWNLVFTQFDRQPDGKLKPLPNKNIDTGMGLERLAAVMQGVKTNFEIDVFAPIVEAVRLYIVNEPRTTNHESRINAIADHIRAVTFAIADGVMPSNEERGYVVRKLIRRAASHGRDISIREPFLYKLVSVVAEVMKAAYPELKEKRDDIAQVVKREEENFLFVLETQVPKAEAAFAVIATQTARRSRSRKGKQSKRDCFGPSGLAMTLAEAAFNFYDTYGMPYDLLKEIAEKFHLKIDKQAFEGFLEKQREKSRSKTKIKSEIFSETFAKKVEALGLKTEFLGYEKAHSEAKVLAVLEGGEVILDKTPFYGESGGQVGDWGRIETESGVMEVEDAKKIGETIVHIGRMLTGSALKKGEAAKVSIDEETRRKVMANHTATHLLQAALRKVLGGHVRQTGSLVDSVHLRFDFTHMKKMGEREIARTEEAVNENIRKAIPVKKEIKGLEEARAEGAIALFGEKYNKEVRVVSIGDVSKELCGGTHVENTKEIGLFKITSESSIASGVRRIEALTGEAAREWMLKQDAAKESEAAAQKEKDQMEKRAKERLKLEIGRVDSIIAKGKIVGATKIITEIIDDIDIEGLRILSDKIREKEKSALVILSTKTEGKASFIISLTEDLVKKNLNAASIAKELAKLIEGSGGGKEALAQGGGKSPEKIELALGKIIEGLKGGLAR